MNVLQNEFYCRDTITVAKALLEKFFVRERKRITLSGKIVEKQVYLKDDPACHASRGMTPRSYPM